MIVYVMVTPTHETCCSLALNMFSSFFPTPDALKRIMDCIRKVMSKQKPLGRYI
jgi:hypothetical protein